jgi:hypothetical protein
VEENRVKMTVSVKCMYFFTIIFLAVTGNENKQVSDIHMLIIMAQFTSEQKMCSSVFFVRSHKHCFLASFRKNFGARALFFPCNIRRDLVSPSCLDVKCVWKNLYREKITMNIGAARRGNQASH